MTSTKTVVAFTCAHSTPEYGNERADWLGSLLFDVRPDYVIDLGDTADMKSLNSYDTRKPEAIVAQNYERDIEHHLDFQQRIRRKFKDRKVKRPRFYGFEGNHEHRIKVALSADPRLGGSKYGISFDHLETTSFYDNYHEYENGAPATHDYDGVTYAHYISSGNYGTAMSGEHHAYNLLKKKMKSTTVGHSHKRSQFFRDDVKAIGTVAGCFKGGPESWAGQANADWWSGVIIKRQVENGYFEPQWVSTKTLREQYA
jgi:hypothetical protein